MTTNDSAELDEILIYFGTTCAFESLNGSDFGAEKNIAKRKILALINKRVAEARIDELIGVRGWTEYEPDPKYSPAERFHIVPYTYLTKRIEELKRSKE